MHFRRSILILLSCCGFGLSFGVPEVQADDLNLSNQTVTLSGTSANYGFITFDDQGALNILNGSTITASTAIFQENGGANANEVLSVSGTGSSLTIPDNGLYTAYGTVVSVNVTNGGYLSVPIEVIVENYQTTFQIQSGGIVRTGNFSIGNSAINVNEHHDVFVTGAGSRFEVLGLLSIGQGATTGYLSVSDGGLAQANSGAGLNMARGRIDLNGTGTSRGTLELAAYDGYGATFNFDGGILRATADFAIQRAITTKTYMNLGAGGGYFDTNGHTMTLGGDVSMTGAGTLYKMGAGNLVLTALNSYSGGTTINSGILQAANSQAVGSGTVRVNGGTFLVQNGVSVSNPVTLSGGGYDRVLGASANLANAINSTSNFAGTAPDTTAKLLQGTLSSSGTLHTGFSNLSSATNDVVRQSDVYSLNGTGSDIFALQLSVTGVTANSILSWVDTRIESATYNQWINAVEGNTGGTPTFVAGAYDPALDFHLGYYGVDTVTGNVWAVINHNSSFSVTTVPEPSSIVLLSLGFAGLAGGVMRRRR